MWKVEGKTQELGRCAEPGLASPPQDTAFGGASQKGVTKRNLLKNENHKNPEEFLVRRG